MFERLRDTIFSFLSCSHYVDNRGDLQSRGVESLQQGSKRKSIVVDVLSVFVDTTPTSKGISNLGEKDESCVVLSSTPPTPIVVL